MSVSPRFWVKILKKIIFYSFAYTRSVDLARPSDFIPTDGTQNYETVCTTQYMDLDINVTWCSTEIDALRHVRHVHATISRHPHVFHTTKSHIFDELTAIGRNKHFISIAYRLYRLQDSEFYSRWEFGQFSKKLIFSEILRKSWVLAHAFGWKYSKKSFFYFCSNSFCGSSTALRLHSNWRNSKLWNGMHNVIYGLRHQCDVM